MAAIMSPEYGRHPDLQVLDMDEVMIRIPEDRFRLGEFDEHGRYGTVQREEVPFIIDEWIKELETSKRGEEIIYKMLNEGGLMDDCDAIDAYGFFRRFCPVEYKGRYGEFVDDCIGALNQLVNPKEDFDENKGKVLRGLVTRLYDDLGRSFGVVK